ncbi:hypothetical protein [Hydrogenophaga flava]|uniref:hypothetical protein n=1 Tax=Hydrogenophaga flava TaxID=65657 RepID=UPI0008245EDF|nr:hypothetical protein [Hydrogenophaga flava]
MLIALQRSALSGFTYDLAAADGTVIGELCFPDWAEARNARLKNPAPGRLRSSIDLRLSGEAYTIEFEYTRRGWNNDTRFELMQGGARLASAEVVVPQGFFGRARLLITEPFSGELVRRSTFFKTRFELQQDGQALGLVHEPQAFTTRRRLCAEVPPDVPPPVQGFLLFLVINLAFG